MRVPRPSVEGLGRALGSRLLTRAALLTLALLGWEVGLLWLITGDLGPDAGALGRRLAWDFALLFPLLTGALGFAAARARREGRPADAPRASTVALAFVLLLLPVAAGRGLLQQRASRPPSQATGQAVSATSRDVGEEGRFLCSSVSPEAAGGARAEGPGTPLQALWAGVQEALVLQAPVFPLALFLLRRRRGPERAPRTVLPAGALPLLLVVVGALGSDEGGAPREPPPAAQVLAGGCAPDAPVRAYAVAAIDVLLPLNAHGDHLPRGLMYVLEEALPAVREQERRPPEARVRGGLREEPIQPLVLRANLGECLVVRFTNRLEQERAALRIEGLRATVSGPQGGFLPGDAVRTGQSLTLVLPLPSEPEAEGAYLLHDPEEDGRREARGLFGALVLEPAGSVYRDSATGEPLKGSRWEAIIDVPEGRGRDFREAVLLFHALGPPEEADVRFANGAPLPVLDEMAGPFRPGGYGLNYRSEPRFDRDDYLDSQDGERPRSRNRPREPATPKLRSYLGEPTRVRTLHAGSAEFHVPHLHGRRERELPQLREEPSSPGAARLLGPGRSVTFDFGEGFSPFPSEAGDFVYHCHMPNHGLGGIQGSWRVSTVLQEDLAPLPDRAPPP